MDHRLFLKLSLALSTLLPPAGWARAAGAKDDVDAPPAFSAPVDSSAYAVVIGVQKYRRSDVPDVEFASHDARIVRDYLTKSMGFDPANVLLVRNEKATRDELHRDFGRWLGKRVTAQSRVFVYFAGHGTPDLRTGGSYLMPYDGDPAKVESTAYSILTMLDALSRLPAKSVLVVLDASFAGQGKRSIAKPGAKPLLSLGIPATAGKNTVVISAAAAGQGSAHSPEKGHGLLTYFLLKGLRGAAADKAGRVTTSGLFAYVESEVESEARRKSVEQTPAIAPELEQLGVRADDVWISVPR